MKRKGGAIEEVDTFDLPQVLTTRVDRRAGQLGRLPSKTISSSSVKGLSVS